MMSLSLRIASSYYLLVFGLIFMMLISSCQPETGSGDFSEASGMHGARQSAGSSTQPESIEPEQSGWEDISGTPTYAVYFTLTPPFPTVSPPAVPPTPTLSLTPSPTPKPENRMCSPLEDHTLEDLLEIVSFPFDPPPEGKDTGHHGVDFAYYRRGDRLSILGVPIQSVLPGKAAAVVLNRAPYGYMLIVETRLEDISTELQAYLEIEQGESLYLLYAHMDSPPFTKVGDEVICGEVVGEVGNTPPEWSSAPHLHFEARIGPKGVIFESMEFYTSTASPEEMDAYRLWRMSGEFRLIDPLDLLIFGLIRQAY
jgi:murein DD-endopeptidase MepM/ murein hydrolase activator NlpD